MLMPLLEPDLGINVRASDDFAYDLVPNWAKIKRSSHCLDLGQMCITNAESHPFIMAVIGGHSDIVELLLNEDSIVNSLALIKACEYSRG
jgi:hypothetical protein